MRSVHNIANDFINFFYNLYGTNWSIVRRDAMSTVESASPSQCCLGDIADPNAPAFLGQGFGPKFLWDMYTVWKTTCAKTVSEYDSLQVNRSKHLAAVLKKFPRQGAREENFSCPISVSLHRLLSTFSAFERFHLVHQVHIPGIKEAADIAAVDAEELALHVHGVLEVKWEFEFNLFPELQGSAFSRLYNIALPSDAKDWMPIFVLTKDHFQLGIAWGNLCNKWAYSSIFTSEVENFDPEKAEHVLAILHFADFFAYSIQQHRDTQIRPDDFEGFYDNTGTMVPIIGPFFLLGDRALIGVDSTDKKKKVLKFYQNKVAADDAVLRATAFARVLDYCEYSATVYCGFGPEEHATCVVAYTYWKAEPLTYAHLIDLTDQIEKLSQNYLIHGDMRPCNLVPILEGKIRAIDFDWAGTDRRNAKSLGLPIAKFPSNVNVDAFGKHAKDQINRGGLIGLDFDHYCLADLLEKVGSSSAAKLAVCGHFGRVRSALMKNITNNIPDDPMLHARPTFLNLRSVPGRVGNYYRKTRKVVKAIGKRNSEGIPIAAEYQANPDD